MNTTTRNAGLPDLLQLLQQQHARKHDMVVPATALRSVDADLIVSGADHELSVDGVTTRDARFRPTRVADEGIAAKLNMPLAYLRRLRDERPDLYDANVNGWLHGRKAKVRPGAPTADGSGYLGRETEIVREAIPADGRRFLLRTFRGDDGQPGVARALLSDRYSVVDNLDVLLAALDGVQQAGVEVNVTGGDLTDRRMVIRVACPAVQALAPTLLAGYRSPFTGQSGDENPTVFAGFQISNSETGGGAFTITPRLVVQVCTNGMTITKDAMREVHLGGKMEEGVIRWTEDTQRKALELVQARTRDAVATFLDTDYLTRVIQRAEAKAATEVPTVEDVTKIGRAAGYTQEQVDGILGYFVKGGQMSLGGVMNAATAYAQTVEDGDAAYDIEARATALLGV